MKWKSLKEVQAENEKKKQALKKYQKQSNRGVKQRYGIVDVETDEEKEDDGKSD